MDKHGCDRFISTEVPVIVELLTVSGAVLGIPCCNWHLHKRLQALRTVPAMRIQIRGYVVSLDDAKQCRTYRNNTCCIPNIAEDLRKWGGLLGF